MNTIDSFSQKYGKLSLVSSVLAFFAVTFLVGLGSSLAPLLVAFVLAYLTFPTVEKLEGLGVKRGLAVKLIIVLILILTILGSFFLLPLLAQQARQIVGDLPFIVKEILSHINEVLQLIGLDMEVKLDDLQAPFLIGREGIDLDLLGSGTGLLKTFFSSTLGIILSILNILLVPLFFLFIIQDYEKILRELKSFFPQQFRPFVQRYIDMINKVLNGFVRGQLLVAIILSVIYSTVLTLIGLEFSIFIGIFCGFFGLVPYLGSFSGFCLSVISALSYHGGYGTLIGVVLTFAVVHSFDVFYMTPKLVGNKVGISAFAAVLALIVGGNLFGFVGVFVAIPVAAIIIEILRDLRAQFT